MEFDFVYFFKSTLILFSAASYFFLFRKETDLIDQMNCMAQNKMNLKNSLVKKLQELQQNKPASKCEEFDGRLLIECKINEISEYLNELHRNKQPVEVKYSHFFV